MSYSTEGPLDVSTKPRKLQGADILNPSFEKSSQLTFQEFSSKVVTASTPLIPPVASALVDRIIPIPNHQFNPLAVMENWSCQAPMPVASFNSMLQSNNFALEYNNLALEYNNFAMASNNFAMASNNFAMASDNFALESNNWQEHYSGNGAAVSLPTDISVKSLSESTRLQVPWVPKEGSTSLDSSESRQDSIGMKPVISSITGNTLQADEYQCLYCHNIYVTHRGLLNHRKYYCYTLTKKPFNCKYCDKVCTPITINEHIFTHTRPYKCGLCVKTFSKPLWLKQHSSTHTGEKLFECSHCSSAFSDLSSLKKHVQIHYELGRKVKL